MAASFLAAASMQVAYMNWIPVKIWVFNIEAVLPLPVLVGIASIVSFGFSAAFYMSGYLATQEQAQRAQREVAALRDERRRILELCDSIELPIPFSSVIENNVVRPAPLRLGQYTARVRAEPRTASAASS